MRTLAITALLIVSCAGQALAQIDAELSAHIASRRKVMDDTTRPIADREAVALEVAAALDRAAWTANAPGPRGAAWSEARAVLEGFSTRNPDHPKSRLFAFQAAVYLWAEGHDLMPRAEAGDAPSRTKAASSLDAAIARLRPIVSALPDPADPLAQNARFRLAQALLDRTRLDPDRPAPPELRDVALKTLQSSPITEKNLIGFANLLKADLLAGAGQFDSAREALNASSLADVKPSEGERLTVAVAIDNGRKQFAEARSQVEASSLPATAKSRLKLTIALAERSATEAGADRAKVEAEVFALASEIRKAGGNEAAAALRQLARAIDEPGTTLGSEAWSLLAEGATLAGQADRGSRLDVIAANKAEAKGDLESARKWRFRAAAVAYGASQFVRAESLFARVLADTGAGPLRARAGMLRALSQGRALASAGSPFTRDGYLGALADQVRDFPEDPATGEARWLLGRERKRDGDIAETEKLWTSIPRAHARWLDSRVALASLRREAIDERRLVDDPSRIASLVTVANDALDRDRIEARDEGERTDLDIEKARLAIAPGAGNPKVALAMIERLRRLPLREDQREPLEVLRIVAMAASEKSIEAERAAGEFSGSVGSRLDLARQLDRWASTATPDRLAQRIASAERIVADRLENLPKLTPEQKAETRLRRARGRVLASDLEGGRAILSDWADPASELPEELADVADLLAQAGEPARAVSAYRRLAKETQSGSPRWFAARLGQARALFASGQVAAAKKLVEGTALLNPDLGGPAMKAAFETLRAKLARR